MNYSVTDILYKDEPYQHLIVTEVAGEPDTLVIWHVFIAPGDVDIISEQEFIELYTPIVGSREVQNMWATLLSVALKIGVMQDILYAKPGSSVQTVLDDFNSMFSD